MELSDVAAARRTRGLVVLEGFHAVKHAIRFGAELRGAWTADPAEVQELTRRLAPDVQIPVEVVEADALRAVVPRAQLVAVALAPEQADPDTVLAGRGHVVLLEDPRHLGNLGAVVRVAAAAGAAGVMTTGRLDPWHPDALRGSAGLHFALPVHRLRAPRTGDRELIVLDPAGEPLAPAEIPDRAVLAFGTERDGLTDELLAQADRRLALPMSPGVSSLNLATGVAATLYTLKLATAGPPVGSRRDEGRDPRRGQGDAAAAADAGDQQAPAADL
jgi:RNA methyltransferase, TrmH family